jgi:hypothetical protein
MHPVFYVAIFVFVLAILAALTHFYAQRRTARKLAPCAKPPEARLEEHDVVRATTDIPDHMGYSVPAGTRGVIVHMYGSECEVEFDRRADLPRVVRAPLTSLAPYVAPPAVIATVDDITALIERGRYDGQPWTATQILVLRQWRHAFRQQAETGRPTYDSLRRAMGSVDHRRWGDLEADERRMRTVFNAFLDPLKKSLT